MSLTLISRRTAIKAGIGAAAAVQLGGLPARAAEPKRGGFARIATNDGSQTDSLDPITWPGSFTGSALGGALCNNLTEILPDRSVAGDLAESFEGSDKSRKWTFKLKPGLTFHNGKSLTADDVVAAMKHHMGPNTKSPAKAVLALVTDVKADDKATVVFTLSDSSARSALHAVRLSPADHAGEGRRYDGSVGAGRQRTLRHGALDARHAGQDEAQSQLLQSEPPLSRRGRVHPDSRRHGAHERASDRRGPFLQHLDIKTLALLQRNPSVRVQRVPSTAISVFDMNTQLRPSTTRTFGWPSNTPSTARKSSRRCCSGTGQVGNDNNVAPIMKFWAETPPNTATMPRKRRTSEAGGAHQPQGRPVSRKCRLPRRSRCRAAVQGPCGQGRHHINIVREPDDGYWGMVWRKKNFVGVDWYGRATVDWLFSTTLAKDAAWNDTKF